MSQKFYAVDRETGEKWVGHKDQYTHEYLVMYDTGYLAVVNDVAYETTISTLDPKKWRIVVKKNFIKKILEWFKEGL